MNKVTLKILTIFALLCFSGFANADVGELIVGDVLDKADGAAQKSINNAAVAGDALLSRSANELSVLVSAARLGMEDSMSRQVSDLDVRTANLLTRIDTLTNQLDNFKSAAYNFRDTTVVDVRELLNDVPFLASAEFYVQKIDGLAHYELENEVTFKIAAVNVGPDTSDRRSAFKIIIDGKEVSIKRIERHSAGEVKIVLPADVFISHFSPDIIKLVKADISIDIQKKTGWFFKSWNKPQTYTVPVWISLIPKTAATVYINGRSPVFGWKYERTESFSQVGPDAHCSDDCRGWYGTVTSMAKSVTGGNEPIVGYERISKITSFGIVSGVSGFDADVWHEISNNSRTAIGHWRARTHANTYKLNFDVEKYQRLSNDILKVKNEIMDYGEVKAIRVPVNATELVVTGKTLNNKTFSLVAGATNPDSLVEIANVQIDGNEKIILIRAKQFEQLYN